MLVINLIIQNEPAYVNVADSTNDCHRNCPEDAQEPHKCSREDIQDPCLRGRLDSVLPDLCLQSQYIPGYDIVNQTYDVVWVGSELGRCHLDLVLHASALEDGVGSLDTFELDKACTLWFGTIITCCLLFP